MQSTVRWRGQTADYTTAERLLMADLPVREQALVHTLKAFTPGEIQNPLEIQGVKPPVPAGNLASSDQQSDRVPRPGTSGVTQLKVLTQGEVSEARVSTSDKRGLTPALKSEADLVAHAGRSTGPENLLQAPGPGQEGFALGGSIPPAGTVYTDPEDLEFGKPKARAKIYAVIWTGGNHRRCKTKDGAKDRRSATKTIKTWLRWYERQGWKVTFGSQAAGWYIAANEKGDRHAISLHEYDRETGARLS